VLLAILLGGASVLSFQAGNAFYAVVLAIGGLLTIWALFGSRDGA
jgi:hypothetical protein